jgi:hypothetical protein
MHVDRPTAAITLPDYRGGSIVNLMASLGLAMGTREPSRYAPIGAIDPEGFGTRGSVLLLVIDGLGYRYLREVLPSGTLTKHLVGSLTSVFPSTTATAITAFMTGLAPQQHAVTGWSMYFDDIAMVGAVLPFRTRPNDEPLANQGLHPETFFDHPAFFDQLPCKSFIVSPNRIVDSEFSVAHSGTAQRRGYGSLAEFFDTIQFCLRGRNERKFVYAYYPELDSIAHAHGIASRNALDLLDRLDDGIGRLLSCLTGLGVTVVVTADHGFVDAPQTELIELDDHPLLAATLSQPLCGERRAAYCYVKPEKTGIFVDYVRNELDQHVSLWESQTLINEGWFGLGEPHPKLASRVGDYTLVMKNRATIKDWMPGERHHSIIGVHGGVSAEEMIVPLVVARP